MERTNYSRLFLLWMITTFLYGATTFLVGFFPINNYSMENAEQQGRPQYLDDLKLIPPTQRYDQTILMLVDALRYDFPTPKTMPFSYNHSCSRLKIRVNIPTVTMPRIKSLTTGTVSNFIDIVLNIGHVEKLSDSLLHHLHKRNDTAVFAGDRTWKSLFPKQFKRLTANTDSFFVNDFYEGDKNVTDVLSKELDQTDWMLLILHYLGLDHIGHVEGTESAKLPLKLKEMDDVIRMMYERKHFHSQLLLLTGDHGMKDGGGHGGSTTGEMHVPLFVFNGNCSRKGFRSDAYNQIDVAPTLAILWSIDIPNMSIGSVIPELLYEYSLEDQLYAYYYNALHLIRKVKRKFGQEYFNSSVLNKWLKAAVSAHKQYLLTKRNHKYDNAFFFEEAKTHYLRLSRDISEQLSDSLVQFDYGLITIGLTLITMVVLHTFIVFYAKNRRRFIGGKILWLSVIAIAISIYLWCHQYEHFITTTGTTSFLLVLTAILSIVYLFINIVNLIVRELFTTTSVTRLHFSLPSHTWVLLAFLAFHIISLVSSSYIEMESCTWHYLGSSAVILLSAQTFFKSLCTFNTSTYEDIADTAVYKIVMKTFLKSHSTWLLIGGLGLLKRSYIIAFYINKEKAKIWLSCYFVAGLLILLLCLVQQNFVQTRKEFALYALAASLVYGYRSSIGTVCSVVDTSCCANIFVNIFWIVIALAAAIGCATILLRNAKSYYFDYHHQSANTVAAGCFQVLLNLVLITSVLLHKPHNVFLVATLIYVLSICYRMCDAIEKRTYYKYIYLQKAIYTIIVANMFYYAQGNSNSFATIDLNPGYIGQTTYKPLIVGILVTLNMYSAQFIAFLYLIAHILHDSNKEGQINKTHKFCNVTEHVNFILYFYTLTIFVTVLYYFWLLISFRYHLFIYSVFAPKALYEYYRVIVLLVTFLMITANLFIFGL